LIILDVYVPKVDGFSAAKQIKKDFAHRAHNYALDAVNPSSAAGGSTGIRDQERVAAVLLRAVDAVLQGQTFFARRLDR
jgi:DNA-binding NarL/FixJ family response regulator